MTKQGSREQNNQDQQWEEIQLYGRFKRLTSDNVDTKTSTRLKKENRKRETEFHLIAAQNNAIRINHIKVRIDKIQQNSKCLYEVIETKRSTT